MVPTANSDVAGRPRFPLELGPGGEIRWRAISVDGRRVSRSFKFWVQGNDAYVCQRSVGEMKISLHESGEAHSAFRDHATSEAWLGTSGSRYLAEWNDPPPFHPGWIEIFGVVNPESELTAFEELPPGGERIIQFPVPAGMALFMLMFRQYDPGFSTSVNFDDSIHVATIEGKTCRYMLVAIIHSWQEANEKWAREARLDTPGSGSRSLVPPRGFDRKSPGARLLKFVSNTKGGRWLVDLAANDPPRMVG